jgi:hypothetical protein
VDLGHAVALAEEARDLIDENESNSVLGGALKRMAVTASGAKRRRLIARSAAAYQGKDVHAETAVEEARADTYRKHNAYQLAVLISGPEGVAFERPASNPKPVVMNRLIDQTRVRYVEYWDASDQGDAALTELLTAKTDEERQACREKMINAYINAFEGRSTWRERSSTIDHLRDLHDLLPETDDRRSQLAQALMAFQRWAVDNKISDAVELSPAASGSRSG